MNITMRLPCEVTECVNNQHDRNGYHCGDLNDVSINDYAMCTCAIVTEVRKTPEAKEDLQNDTQQLKAEIHRLADKWRNSNMTTAQLVIELDRLSGELSAV